MLQIIAMLENNLLAVQINACKSQNAMTQWRHGFNQFTNGDMRTKINNLIAKPNPALEGLPRAYATYGKRNRPFVIQGEYPA